MTAQAAIATAAATRRPDLVTVRCAFCARADDDAELPRVSARLAYQVIELSKVPARGEVLASGRCKCGAVWCVVTFP